MVKNKIIGKRNQRFFLKKNKKKERKQLAVGAHRAGEARVGCKFEVAEKRHYMEDRPSRTAAY